MSKTKTREFELPPSDDLHKQRQFAHKLAQEEFDKANGDRVVAFDVLMRLVTTRPDLARALQTAAYERFWRDYLKMRSKNQRKRIVHKARDSDENQAWAVPDTLGEGFTAKRQNMDTIYDYQFPYLTKGIGLSTPLEFAHAFRKVLARHETDKKFIGLGEAIKSRIAKADKDAIIQDIVSAEDLARIFRQSGVVT